MLPSLPFDMLSQILELIPYRDRLRLQLVCRAWRDINAGHWAVIAIDNLKSSTIEEMASWLSKQAKTDVSQIRLYTGDVSYDIRYWPDCLQLESFAHLRSLLTQSHSRPVSGPNMGLGQLARLTTLRNLQELSLAVNGNFSDIFSIVARLSTLRSLEIWPTTIGHTIVQYINFPDQFSGLTRLTALAILSLPIPLREKSPLRAITPGLRSLRIDEIEVREDFATVLPAEQLTHFAFGGLIMAHEFSNQNDWSAYGDLHLPFSLSEQVRSLVLSVRRLAPAFPARMTRITKLTFGQFVNLGQERLKQISNFAALRKLRIRNLQDQGQPRRPFLSPFTTFARLESLHLGGPQTDTLWWAKEIDGNCVKHDSLWEEPAKSSQMMHLTSLKYSQVPFQLLTPMDLALGYAPSLKTLKGCFGQALGAMQSQNLTALRITRHQLVRGYQPSAEAPPPPIILVPATLPSMHSLHIRSHFRTPKETLEMADCLKNLPNLRSCALRSVCISNEKCIHSRKEDPIVPHRDFFGPLLSQLKATTSLERLELMHLNAAFDLDSKTMPSVRYIQLYSRAITIKGDVSDLSEVSGAEQAEPSLPSRLQGSVSLSFGPFAEDDDTIGILDSLRGQHYEISTSACQYGGPRGRHPNDKRGLGHSMCIVQAKKPGICFDDWSFLNKRDHHNSEYQYYQHLQV